MDADKRFIGFVPAFRDVADWRLLYRRDHTRSDGRVLRQVVWGHARDENQRLHIEVIETGTAQAARDAAYEAAQEKSVPFQRGPDRFGPWSFVYPDERAHSVNLAWENLAISVFSSGRRQSPVEEWVDRILDELRA